MIGEASTTRRMPSLAACDTTLPFTTGGDAEWFAQTTQCDAACPEPVPDLVRDRADSNAVPPGGLRPTLHDSDLIQSSIINNQFLCHPNPFLFTGRRYDTETGLHYYRARYYNPTIGRFLQTDPIAYDDGMNMYRYCRNNPIYWVDPSGLEPVLRDVDWWGDPLPPYLQQWLRPDGHPEATVGRVNGPYYTQVYKMACVPAAVANWLLTYDNPLDENLGLSTDKSVIDYIGDLWGEWHDWDEEGVKNLEEARSVIGKITGHTEGIHIVEGRPDAQTLWRYVVQNKKAVMVAYDMHPSERITSRHCVLLVPTPKSYGWGFPSISVADGTHPGATAAMGAEEFAKWWADCTDNGWVLGYFMAGPRVPGQ